MSSWLKDIGDVLYDDTHILLTRQQYDSLDCYNNIRQPTNPSVGRIFRCGSRPYPGQPDTGIDGQVVIVEEDPEPGYVLRRGRLPLFIEQ